MAAVHHGRTPVGWGVLVMVLGLLAATIVWARTRPDRAAEPQRALPPPASTSVGQADLPAPYVQPGTPIIMPYQPPSAPTLTAAAQPTVPWVEPTPRPEVVAHMQELVRLVITPTLAVAVPRGTATIAIVAVGPLVYTLDHTFLDSDRMEVHAFDATDPLAPRLLGAIPVSSTSYDLMSANGELFVATRSGFERFALRPSALPQPRGGSATVEHATGLAIVDGHAYVSSDGLTRDSAQMSTYRGAMLTVFDVSAPDGAQQVSHLQVTDDGASQGIVVHQQRAYMPLERGLAMIDIRNPARLRTLAMMLDRDRVASLRVEDGRAYVAAGDFMKIYDTSDPDHWVLLNGISTRAYFDGPKDMVPAGEEIYLAWRDGGSPLRGGLAVFRERNGGHVEIVGRWAGGDNPGNDIAVTDTHVYFAAGKDGLLVFTRPVR